jgi:alanyl-tRNA synthetase
VFTGSGMQPLLPYLLGAPHPAGDRLVDSQTCLRADDIDEVGDSRHTTFFEMLRWSARGAHRGAGPLPGGQGGVVQFGGTPHPRRPPVAGG